MLAISRAFTYLALLAYVFFCYLMLDITLQYIPLNTDVAFLRIKQDYIHLGYYRWAFFIHAYCAILALPAGFTQFSASIRKNQPAIHRYAGWFYAAVIVLLAAPSGLVIGVYANGGWSSQLAFSLLAVFWFYFTLQAVLKIRKGDFMAHRDFMVRSFALTLSAITLRMWKYFLVALFHPRPMDVYRTVAWLGWVLNLVIAEVIIYKLNQKKA